MALETLQRGGFELTPQWKMVRIISGSKLAEIYFDPDDHKRNFLVVGTGDAALQEFLDRGFWIEDRSTVPEILTPTAKAGVWLITDIVNDPRRRIVEGRSVAVSGAAPVPQKQVEKELAEITGDVPKPAPASGRIPFSKVEPEQVKIEKAVARKSLDPIRRYPYGLMAKYPHMKPEDVAVWERFIKKNPHYFEDVDYDYLVGEGEPQGPDVPANIARGAKILTQKKVDVIGYIGHTVFITEIGPVADMRKLGQVLTYYSLYLQNIPVPGSFRKLVIAGEIEREMSAMFDRYGVRLEIA